MKDVHTISAIRNIALAGILATGIVATPYTVALAYADEAAGESSAESDGADSSESTDDAQSILDKLFGSNDKDAEDEAEAPSKTETVYVFTQADGTVKNTIVADWLKNVNGDSSIDDVSNLADIENTEGTETFEQDGDAVTWDAQGSDIYYKGNSDADAPVKINVTYTLDGQTVSPEDLVGKSGTVTIRYDYTNTSTVQETVNGEAKTFYTPFACVTGLMLDNDKFTNISVENGRMGTDGDHTVVAGFAFPGLQQDLDLSDDAEIPDHFEITADVTDFELGTTMTYVSSGLLDGIQTDDLDEDAIGDDIEQVEDAMGQLMSGSDELAEGLDTLADGSHTLADGAVTLAAGSVTLASGTATLQSSAAALPDGMNQLSSAATQVNAGLKLLANGNSTQTGLKDAVTSIGAGSASTQTLYGGTLALQSGLAQLKGTETDTTGSLYAAKNGADQITVGARSLSEGTSKLIAAIGSSSDNSTSTVNGALNIAQSKLNGTGDVAEALKALQDAGTTLETVSQDAQTAADDLNSIATALGKVDFSALENGAKTAASASSATVTDINNISATVSGVDDAKSAINAINTSGLSDEQKTAVEAQKAAAINALDSVSASTTGTDQALKDAQTAAAASKQVADGLTQAQTSLSALQTSITADATAFQTAATQLGKDAATLKSIDSSKVANATDYATVQQLLKGVQTNLNTAVGTSTDTSGTLYAAKNGADAIATGSQAISSGMGTAIYAIDNQFNPGLEQLKSGLTTLSEGGTAPDGRTSAGLSGAVSALGDSSTQGTLIYGTNALDVNLQTVAQQTPALIDGIDQIASGSSQLATGANTLATGADTLATGADTAAEGSHTLADGLDEFNDQVVQKIVDAYHDNLEGLSDNLRATVQAGKDYSTFSGKSDAMDGSVKFVYETDPIEASDDDSSNSADASADDESTSSDSE